MNPNNPIATTYQAAVMAARAAARDIARSKQVSNLMTTLRMLQALLAGEEKALATHVHNISIAKYEMENLDTEHPDYEARKESAEKNIERLVSNTETLEKRVKEARDEVAAQEEAIAKVESGEWKCSFDTMVDRAKALLEDRFGQAFKDGKYDNQDNQDNA